MINYGSGYTFVQQTLDGSGNTLALGPRTILSINQEISFDMGFTVKELYGQNQWAEDVARGAMKLTGKVKFGQLFGAALDSMFFGQPGQLVSGTLQNIQVGTSAQAIPITPYTITITPSGGATFVQDECVINAATGIPMVPVTGVPTAGQYAVTGPGATGTYTFSSADSTAGVSVFINYLQKNTSLTAAYSQDVQSMSMGSTPLFSLSHTVQHLGKKLTLIFPRATSTKLNMAFKNEDYMIPEMDFTVMRDPVTNKVLTWSTSE